MKTKKRNNVTANLMRQESPEIEVGNLYEKVREILDASRVRVARSVNSETGKGFCFVGRQARITIDGDHFYNDLVLYNRLLRCFVLIDLKLGKLMHEDLGQMMLYTNYYTRELLEDWENPTIGILLCADKNDAVVKYTLPENARQIFASRYQLYLPSEEEILREIREQQARLAQSLSD